MSSPAHQMRQARDLDTLFELRLRRARRAMQLARHEFQLATQLVQENRRAVQTLRSEMQSLNGLPANVVNPALITQLHDRQLRTRWLRLDLHEAVERLNSALETLSEKQKTLEDSRRHWQQLKQRRECLDEAWQEASMDYQIRSMAVDELQVAEQICASTTTFPRSD